MANKCTSGSCKACKDNTLLHAKTETARDGNNDGEDKAASAITPSSAVVTHSSSSGDKQVMLSTAVVDDHEGSLRECRVLLDCGSQANFISRKILNLLAVKPRSPDIFISEINGTITQSSQVAHLKLHSRFNSYSINIICIIADQVTNKLPAFNLKHDTFDLHVT